MQRISLSLSAIAGVAMVLTGCSNEGNRTPDSSVKEKGQPPTYLEKELKSAITDDMTLDEMLDVMYRVTSENKKLSACSWSDEVDGDFFDYIRSTTDYKTIKEQSILKIDAYLDQT